jgi:C4-type Zn-finger protein
MSIKGSAQTICPSCKKEFNIHRNRSYKIKDSVIPGAWFYHAMNQFENFSQVTCPSCGNNYKAKEARLLVIFRSPYSAVVSTILLLAFIIGIPILLGFYFGK